VLVASRRGGEIWGPHEENGTRSGLEPPTPHADAGLVATSVSRPDRSRGKDERSNGVRLLGCVPACDRVDRRPCRCDVGAVASVVVSRSAAGPDRRDAGHCSWVQRLVVGAPRRRYPRWEHRLPRQWASPAAQRAVAAKCGITSTLLAGPRRGSRGDIACRRRHGCRRSNRRTVSPARHGRARTWRASAPACATSFWPWSWSSCPGQAQVLIEEWRQDYSEHRPQSALWMMVPTRVAIGLPGGPPWRRRTPATSCAALRVASFGAGDRLTLQSPINHHLSKTGGSMNGVRSTLTRVSIGSGARVAVGETAPFPGIAETDRATGDVDASDDRAAAARRPVDGWLHP